MDLVVIPGPDAGPRQIALVDELADDAVRGSLADPDLARDLPKPEVGLCRQRGEHVQMGGEERPSGHDRLIGAPEPEHELRVMCLRRLATGPDKNMTFDSRAKEQLSFCRIGANATTETSAACRNPPGWRRRRRRMPSPRGQGIG